ncbi:hypothetical protein QL285_015908 [Trifolium repens]|nr:hypothetical protein QL285_015908 [Trifolium repens]
MIVCSFNTRGLGSRVKRRKIREVVKEKNVDFLAIQETKLEVIPEAIVYGLWGGSDCDWAFLPAVGNSGGILSVWNKVKSTLVFTFSGEGFVGVCLDLVAENSRCFIVNVYAKCNIRDKRKLWSDILMSKRGFGDGLWCVLGDFNSVRASSERKGVSLHLSSSPNSEMVEFGDFLVELDLIDLPLVGRCFTWFHPNGIAMSRLDRLLVSSAWCDVWGDPVVRVLERDVADHCPLVINYNSESWGPKPFCFNNFWLQNKDFRGVVTNAWASCVVDGWMSFILKERLKHLKGVIKEWSAVTFGEAENKKKVLIKGISELDLKSEVAGLEEVEVVERKRLFEELWVLLKKIDALTYQRSRSKWLKEGDSNYRFFHNCIKARKRRNNLNVLRTPRGWVEGPSLVRKEVVEYFKDHFDDVGWRRPTLDGIDFPQLSGAQVDILTANFTLEEISEVVKGSDGSKSPGPDGFNFAFIKEFWELLKGDVRILFDQFHGNSCLPKSICSYFLTLIPKVASPQSLGDFRPISLLGCIYKLVAKVLVARLAKVIGDLIPNTQSAFIKGRQLVDGVLVVSEVIDYAKKSRKECLIFKVDFEKAYDSVDWGFLDYMLRRFGFGEKWCAWMKACICSGNMSVLVNGCPTEEISIKRGLKQGDPLAPFLFLIVAEGLGALMRMAVTRGRFQPFKVGRGEYPVSILQYVDDTLCIGEASVDNLWALKAVLRGFEMASGLKVNFWKSCLVGINVPNEFMGMASDFLNCRIGNLPFKYLGLPVGASPRLCSTWAPMVDSIRRRLGSWGNKYVSLGGRIVLINAVLNALPIFFLSYLKMPVKVWREVVKIQRNFLWGGLANRRKLCWVKWSAICKPKKEGGLGIKDLRLMNSSLLAKWRWKLLEEGDEMWKKIVVAKYGNFVVGNCSLDVNNFGAGASVWWRDICRLDSGIGWFSQMVSKKVGNGNNTLFWKDVWVGEESFVSRFPRLFGISVQKDCRVGDVGRWENGEWRWSLLWRRNFFVWEEGILQELMEVLGGVTLSNANDQWIWIPGSEDGFSVKSAYVFLDYSLNPRLPMSTLENFVFKFIWKCGVPSKVSALSWQVLLNRAPTRENLRHRGVIRVDESRCPFCDEAVESTCHLFLHCDFAASIWYEIMRWFGVMVVLPPTVPMSFAVMVESGSNKKRRKGLAIIWLAFIWGVWKVRNDRVFNNATVERTEVLELIQRLSWLWFVNNTATGPCMLYEWVWNPGDSMLR